jgi:hypothetical protein
MEPLLDRLHLLIERVLVLHLHILYEPLVLRLQLLVPLVPVVEFVLHQA